jgi:hypothetical protein
MADECHAKRAGRGANKKGWREMAKEPSEKTLLEWARKAVPGLETLDARKSDRLDFHETAVWSLKDALLAAYEAGLQKGARQ